jgi:DNA-binding winged helix-turn-helix (wHTH) protein/TolB-like protein
MLTTEQLQGGFTLGDWEVLPQRGVLCRADEEVHPEPKVLAVLLALARRDGDLVSQNELIDEVWDGRAFGNEPIQRCIALLRRHFGDTRPYEYIETLQRRGYRLIKPVELHVQPVGVNTEAREDNDRDVRRWKVVAAVVAAGFFAVAIYSWLPSREPVYQSIAILPMDNLSGDPGNQYIVEGMQNSLAYRLSELQDFTIKNVRSLQADTDPTDLDVESFLVGALQMEGERLKATWHIVNAEDNVTVGSGEVTGKLGRVFLLQEQLAQAVRAELAGSATPQLLTRPEPKSAAYNSFMRGMYLLERRFEAGNLEAAMVLFQESIFLDENFAPAYLALAQAYVLLPPYRSLPLPEMHRLAIKTVEKGIGVDRSIEDSAASVYGFVYQQQKRWQESEKAHLQAMNAPIVDVNSIIWYSRMLSSVGRREDSVNWALVAEDIDPDNPIVNNRIALTYLWLGNTQMAEKYFQRAGALGSGGRNQELGYALLLLRLGRVDQAEDLAIALLQAEGVPTGWVVPIFAAFADPTLRNGALEVLGQYWAKRSVAPEIVLVARTMMGDVDGAMEIAKLLELPGEIFEMDLLFIDELEPLRLHPEFIPLMEKLGVVDYWETVGCVWEGSQVNCVAG